MNLVNKFPLLLLTVVCAPFNLVAGAQKNSEVVSRPSKVSSASSLKQLSSSLKTIARQVEPSVVQIFSSTLSIGSDSERGGGAVATQQRSSGSGVLISSDGYIITNEHVVEGARRLRVRLNSAVPNPGVVYLNNISRVVDTRPAASYSRLDTKRTLTDNRGGICNLRQSTCPYSQLTGQLGLSNLDAELCYQRTFTRYG